MAYGYPSSPSAPRRRSWGVCHGALVVGLLRLRAKPHLGHCLSPLPPHSLNCQATHKPHAAPRAPMTMVLGRGPCPPQTSGQTLGGAPIVPARCCGTRPFAWPPHFSVLSILLLPSPPPMYPSPLLGARPWAFKRTGPRLPYSHRTEGSRSRGRQSHPTPESLFPPDWETARGFWSPLASCPPHRLAPAGASQTPPTPWCLLSGSPRPWRFGLAFRPFCFYRAHTSWKSWHLTTRPAEGSAGRPPGRG